MADQFAEGSGARVGGDQVLFDGIYYWTKDLPWLYLPTYILLKLPELHVALLALALPALADPPAHAPAHG